RRQMLGRMAALPALASAARPAPAPGRYILGVMATMYGSLPLDEAMSRIRKAGYQYISIGRRHGSEAVFAPDMPQADRTRMLRRIKDLGVTPVMSLGGFGGSDPATENGLKQYLAQLDLCADYQIPVMVGAGPWYYTKFPNIPKRELDWQKEVSRFYAGLEKAVNHAESINVTITLKPHTGVTARARDCMEVVKRIVSPRLKICWDAGNVSFYEGVYPDPDLPDLAPQVKSVCIKDHLGLRGDENFPVPGQGNVDHDLMFRTLFSAGFNGPMCIERVDGRDRRKLSVEVVDERLAAAHKYLVPLLDRITSGG
ncbi:MAG: sugar phosphate isomerase/epimerase, partial [Acidobacteria bacterium]|nr:sugar phosphate isomerase/epimerase [Acidobacteriota bacterium]